MFSQKFILPALALVSAVAAQSTSCGVASSTITINSAADATAFADCKTLKGSLLVSPAAAGVIDISGPGQIVEGLIVHSAGALTSLTSSSIASIGGTMDLFNLTLLSTLQFTELTSVGTISWSALPALSGLTFPSYISKAASVVITNTFLSTLDGINLMTVGNLDINNNKRLTSFSTQVANITQALNIAANGASLDVEFPNLIWANNMTFRNISKLGVPSLAKVNGSLVFDESFFESISLPNLTTVGSTATKAGSLSFVGNADLTNITFPQLISVGGGIQVANNSALQSISFPVLTDVGGAIDLSGNFTTPSMPKLNNVVGALNIQSTSEIDCSKFTTLQGNVVQGKDTCVSATSDPTTLGGSSTSSGSSPSSSSSKGAAAGSYSLNSAAIGLSVVGGLFGMLV